MIGLNFYRSIPTTLKLNGPLLDWSLNPVDASETLTGFATFTGIVTSSYPPDSGDIVEGSYEFHWYLGDAEIFDTAIDPTSNANIESSGNITTCTFTNIPFDDNGKIVSVVADYIPATGEANASNDLLRSDGATLTAFPEINIINQPSDLIIGTGIDGTFGIDAEISPDNGETLNYQWQIDGKDLLNGSQTVTETTEAESAILSVTSDAGDDFTIDFLQLSTFSNFVTGRTYTLNSNADITTRVYAVGGGGGYSNVRSVAGGYGGGAQGITTFYSDTTYYLQVGEGGVNAGRGGFPGGGQGGGGHGRGGGGGGYTGLFYNNVSHNTAMIIAGGGGGGANDPASGGNGGGLEGSSASRAGRGGYGGTQSAGGAAGGADGTAGQEGSQLAGGQGAAGGGAGYYGGGGGQYVGGCCADGAGGGGSGFLSSQFIGSGEFSRDNSAGGGAPGHNGSFKIDRVSVVKQATVTASGVNTPTLTLNTSDSNFGGVVRCVLSADNVQNENGKLESNPVSYEVVDLRPIVKLEAYTFDNQYKTQTINLETTNTFTIDSNLFGPDYSIIQFHCPEEEVTLTLDMYGAKGIDNNNSIGSYDAGNGGQSRIQITPTRDVEYTLIGISNNSALFLYRGSNLIAVVGSGGDAGQTGDGGDGGGVNNPGETGEGRQGGAGGEKVDTLSLSGSYGSRYQNSGLTLYPGDSVATAPLGGRTISCTKGEYWTDQGVSPCSDNSSDKINFVNIDGTTINTSSRIIRGFKPGYTISNTSGAGLNLGGQGGNGATGGSGGISGSGGGGGSGYASGEVTVLSSSLGGGLGNSRFVISSEFGGFYVDAFGRILILSTTDNTLPNDLPQTTGIVNIGDKAVIDDARWQNFLDLARDGTQDYRLTATLNNSTTRITTAAPFNIHKMMNANLFPLADSLNGFKLYPYAYNLWYLAWDEDAGATTTSGAGYGMDYSILSWSPHPSQSASGGYGFGYYGQSSNSFFSFTNYNLFSANYWILPPGVPDF